MTGWRRGSAPPHPNGPGFRPGDGLQRRFRPRQRGALARQPRDPSCRPRHPGCGLQRRESQLASATDCATRGGARQALRQSGVAPGFISAAFPQAMDSISSVGGNGPVFRTARNAGRSRQPPVATGDRHRVSHRVALDAPLRLLRHSASRVRASAVWLGLGLPGLQGCKFMRRSRPDGCASYAST